MHDDIWSLFDLKSLNRVALLTLIFDSGLILIGFKDINELKLELVFHTRIEAYADKIYIHTRS